MLVREDHVAGERSCWWERIMLVEKDHVAGKGSCGCCKMVNYCESMIFAPKNILFHRTDFRLSVRNINRSKLYVSSPRTFSNQKFREIQALCKSNLEKIFR